MVAGPTARNRIALDMTDASSAPTSADLSAGTGGADVVVAGAGIVGLSIALHLQRRGRNVVLVDRGPPGHGTSFGNAGVIERASVVPYAFPRDPGTILRLALNRGSDVYLDRRWLPQVLPWLARYWWHSAPSRLAAAARDMLPLIERSTDEHARLAEEAGEAATSLIRPVGLVNVIREERELQRAAAAARLLADSHGLRLDVLDREGLRTLEPALLAGARGALHWRDPRFVRDPAALSEALAALFESRGGTVVRASASRIVPGGRGWRLTLADGQHVEAADAVIALGPWSPALIAPLGYRLPLAVKRGHHLHYADAGHPPLSRPLVDERAGYVLAPMARGIRLTTGVELADPGAPPSTVQIERAERIARTLLPLGRRLDETPWLGNRPCLPDMRPVIGPAPRHAGLWFAFGHAHHGLTLGPVTGRLIAELVCGDVPFTDPAPYSAARFTGGRQSSKRAARESVPRRAGRGA